MKLMLPPSSKNWLSLAGAVIVLTTFFMIVFLCLRKILLLHDGPLESLSG